MPGTLFLLFRRLTQLQAADKAQHAVDKAVKDEHKTAEALNQAEHKHDNAIAGQRNACKTLEVRGVYVGLRICGG